jgi:hypothetical protein
MTPVTLPAASLAASLVAEYRARGWASVQVGSVSVSINDSDAPEVTVNWPGIGDKNASDTLAFASALTFAAHVAMLTESLLSATEPGR